MKNEICEALLIILRKKLMQTLQYLGDSYHQKFCQEPLVSCNISFMYNSLWRFFVKTSLRPYRLVGVLHTSLIFCS